MEIMNTSLILLSDNVIRHGEVFRKRVKHCIEIEWLYGSKYGGVGFGFNDTYARFTNYYDYPGNLYINIIETTPNIVISYSDHKRVLLCFESKDIREYIIIKGDEKRTTRFTSANPPDGWSIIYFNGDIKNEYDYEDHFAV